MASDADDVDPDGEAPVEDDWSLETEHAQGCTHPPTFSNSSESKAMISWDWGRRIRQVNKGQLGIYPFA